MALTAEVLAGTKARASKFNESSLPVVSSTSDITTPFAGQTVFSTADNMIYRWTGAAWLAIAATGGSTAATMHEARYHQIASAQAVTTSTDTKAKFEQAITVCDDVTPSGTGNTDFLLNRAGAWRISAGIRYLGNAGAGERHLWIETGTTFAAANRQAGVANTNVGAVPVTLNVSTDIRVTAATSIKVGLWHNAGSNTTIDIGFGGTCHIALTWQRPL